MPTGRSTACLLYTSFPKSRYLWEYREEHADAVSAMLESRYGVDGKGGLPDQLERIASQLAEEYWRDYKQDILAIVDDSFLYGYDEFNVGAVSYTHLFVDEE